MARDFADKSAARQWVWNRLSAEGVARFPFPPHGRIPNFAGAEVAARSGRFSCSSQSRLTLFRRRSGTISPRSGTDGLQTDRENRAVAQTGSCIPIIT